MEKTPALFLLSCLTNFIHANSNVLTLPLIHPLSPESPFFRSNLTDEERITTSVIQSNARANYLSKASPSDHRMEVATQLYHYIVKVSLGTFKSNPPYKEYYLEMDTASSLTWLQCEGCTKCFKQTPKPFPKQNSSSFRPFIVNGKPSYYLLQYADGDNTRGQLAQESFYLRSNTGDQKVGDLKFGCGLENFMSYRKTRNNRIAGMIGLGSGDFSMVKQLGDLSKGKFSYCLPLRASKTPSYLRFGDFDKALPKSASATPLYTRKEGDGYFIDLQGISINRTRLNIRPELFAGFGGCVIDSGTPYTRIASLAFDVVKQELEKYFSKFKNLKKVKKNTELCYQRSKPAGYDGLPSLTFHFQGPRADFVMKAEAVFDLVRRSGFRHEYFCLAIVRDAKMTILGSYQQTNHRIIYDTMNKRLIFCPVDCSKNPGML